MPRIVLIAIVIALLGAGAAAWRFSDRQLAQVVSHSKTQVRLRCLMYWQHRSGIADAEFEFRNRRTGLLQAVKAYDPALEWWTPGLQESATAEVRDNYPVSGPVFDDLDMRQVGSVGPLCEGETRYAWDYNVTMLRLLGREHDIQLPYLSPELSRPRSQTPQKAVARPQ